MKRILHLAAVLSASLLATALVSCNRETPEEPEPTEEIQPIIVSVHTGKLYQELGIVDDMSGKVSPGGGFAIIDSVLVYDQAGALVAKSGVESHTLIKKDVVLEEIPEGTYTLVLWQTAYREANGVRAWKIEEETSLPTVKLTTDGGSFTFAWAVGIASATVTHGNLATKVEMTPKAVGSILDVTVNNIPKDKGYIRMSMVGSRNLCGVYLDPSRQEDRWIPDNYIGVLFRVYPEEEGKGKFFSMIQGENLDLTIRGDKDSSYDDVATCQHKTLTVGEHYAVYYDMARATWQPPFFGLAGDFTAWKADRDAGLPVIDPILNWGCNLSDVEAHVHSKNWWRDFGTTSSSKRWFIFYWVSNSIYEAYGFDSQDGKDLNYVICHCDEPSVPVEAARSLVVHQGFLPAGKIFFPSQSKPDDLYFSADKSTEVFIRTYEENGSWRIVYQPTDPDDLPYIIP